MISVKNVTKIYSYYGTRTSVASFFFPQQKKIVALDNVSLEIKAGEIYGLLGPNGAGKTTLIKLMCGLLKLSSGDIRLNGREVFGSQREMGLMLGDTMAYHLMTGYDNLDYVARLYGVENPRKRIRELAKFLQIGDWLDRYVSEYSLGMKVKICLARALIHDPPVLFLDEPTLGLDPYYALHFRNKIKQLGKTIVLTTHYMEEADFLSTRVGILHRGRLVAEGAPGELKTRTASASLADVFIKLSDETNDA